MSNPNDTNNKNGAGRKKDTKAEKKIKEIVKRIRDEDGEVELSRDVLARNELMYSFIKYGASPSSLSLQDMRNTEVSGFSSVVLGLYGKAFEGDLKAIEMIFKLTGLHVDRVDHTSSDGSMTPKNTNINMPIELSREEKAEFLQKAMDLNDKGEF